MRSKTARAAHQIEITGAPASWQLRQLCHRVLGALSRTKLANAPGGFVLSVSCVNAREMTRLNFKYRGKKRPTDVLSFEQAAMGPRGMRFLGDLVLCLPVVRAQAKERGHGVRDELAVLIVHGVLHLLGYDHEHSPREDERMHRAEAAVMKAARLRSAGLIGRARVKG